MIKKKTTVKRTCTRKKKGGWGIKKVRAEDKADVLKIRKKNKEAGKMWQKGLRVRVGGKPKKEMEERARKCYRRYRR
jgi:hypothetical protein